LKGLLQIEAFFLFSFHCERRRDVCAAGNRADAGLLPRLASAAGNYPGLRPHDFVL
jgi:hypothetical protein